MKDKPKWETQQAKPALAIACMRWWKGERIGFSQISYLLNFSTRIWIEEFEEPFEKISVVHSDRTNRSYLNPFLKFSQRHIWGSRSRTLNSASCHFALPRVDV
jgi:hypothetical protein